jgi:hypothetical protein
MPPNAIQVGRSNYKGESPAGMKRFFLDKPAATQEKRTPPAALCVDTTSFMSMSAAVNIIKIVTKVVP